MSTDKKQSIQDILYAWADSYNNRIPTEINKKRDAYLELLKTFTLHGYTEEDIGNRVKNEILDLSVPEFYPHKNKLSIWKKINAKALEQTYISYYKKPQLAQLGDEERQKEWESNYVPKEKNYGEDRPDEMQPEEEAPREIKLLDLSQFEHIEVPEISVDFLLEELEKDNE